MKLLLKPDAVVEEPALDPELVAEIESMVEEVMVERGIPGASIGVVKDGELVYAKGFGVSELGGEEPVTPESLFCLASIGKTVVATALMQLVEQGKIDLDDAVVDYLPYFELADDGYETITIRQLLTHTSGLPDVEDFGYENPAYDVEALDRYVRSLIDTSLIGAPGEGFNYSDMGFDILGDVIAQVSGQPFEEYVEENIFAPLGMKNTTFSTEDADAELFTAPHMLDEDGNVIVSEVFPYNRMHAPSGTLFSNVEDMARFGMAHMNRGKLDGVRILDPSSYDEMWAAQAVTGWEEYFGSLYANYGLGWMVGTLGDHPAFHNVGNTDGYTAHLLLVPDEELALIALLNYNDFDEGVFYSMAVSEPAIETLLGAEQMQTEQPALAPELIAEIESMVEQVMANEGIPGVSIGIVKDGEIAYARGFGVAELGTDRPMTPQSQFAAACVTKGFTAAAIMQLVDQGLIDLDAPVTDYLPYFKLADDRYKEITIHHLLINTAGLPMPNYVEFYGGFSENPTVEPRPAGELRAQPGRQAHAGRPGRQHVHVRRRLLRHPRRRDRQGDGARLRGVHDGALPGAAGAGADDLHRGRARNAALPRTGRTSPANGSPPRPRPPTTRRTRPPTACSPPPRIC